MGGPISGETQTWSQELDLTPYSQFGSPAGNWSLVMSSDGEYIYSYSVTWNAQYLRKEKVISLENIERKESHNSIYISGAKTNNLNDINIDIPLNKLVAITGVSGSGKSSLINHTLIPGVNSKLNNSKSIAGVRASALEWYWQNLQN